MFRRCLIVCAAFAWFGALPVSASADETCPNEALRVEQNSTFLPECRAYEMVSPPDKQGADITASALNTMAAQELAPGEPMAVEFASLAGFGEVNGSGIVAQYMGIRNGSPGTRGWSVHGITPQVEATTLASVATVEQHYLGTLSPDLSHGIFRSWTALNGEEPNTQHVFNLYERTDLRSTGAGSYSLLTACPGCSGPLSLSPAGVYDQPPFFEGAASDLGHVLFASRFRLTSDTPECSYPPELVLFCSPHLYESDHGVVRLVGILPNGSAATVRVVEGGKPLPHQMSNDGTRVIFSEGGQVYERVDNGSPDAQTIDLSESERTDCNIERKETEPGYVCTGAPEPENAGAPATYWDASADGKRVIFTSGEKLSDDAREGHVHLYMYSAEAPAGHHLVALDSSGGLEAQSSELSVIGASEDANYVYFTSDRGQLVAGAPGGQDGPTIFVWHDDGTPTGKLQYIGEAGSVDPGDDIRQDILSTNNSPAAAVTPSGRDLAFVLHDDPSTGELVSPSGYDEVWLYDAEAQSLRCVSCLAPGEEATGPATTFTPGLESSGASAASWPTNHPVTADGRLVFFSTPDALVPQDVNGKVDAYEYDASNGSVHLLSSGLSDSNSYFLEADPSGSDVFISTRQQLVGWDLDQNLDLYDVRVGGGFPNPLAPTPECEGESCQTQSIFQTTTPASVSFSGEGNLVTKPQVKARAKRSCAKGQVLRKAKGKTRCVKRRTRPRKAADRKRSRKISSKHGGR